VRGKNDNSVLADLKEQIEKALPLGRIETGCGFVDDDELGISEQRLGDTEAAAHAAGVSRHGFSTHVVEVS